MSIKKSFSSYWSNNFQNLIVWSVPVTMSYWLGDIAAYKILLLFSSSSYSKFIFLKFQILMSFSLKPWVLTNSSPDFEKNKLLT